MKEKRVIFAGIALALLVMIVCTVVLHEQHIRETGSYVATVIPFD